MSKLDEIIENWWEEHEMFLADGGMNTEEWKRDLGASLRQACIEYAEYKIKKHYDYDLDTYQEILLDNILEDIEEDKLTNEDEKKN